MLAMFPDGLMHNGLAMLKYITTAFLLIFSQATLAKADDIQTVMLWPGKAPGAIGDAPDDHPTLTVFLPPAGIANGTGAVICPGGSYRTVMSTYEGEDIAHWLNSLGGSWLCAHLPSCATLP